MSRIKYRQVVRDAQGDATADALITVRNAAGTLATIYDAVSGGSALGNGTTFVSGDGDPEKVGAFEFWIDAADQGLFSITVGSGASADTFPVAITEQPAANFTSRSALVTAWSDELYADGTIVSDGSVFYKAVAGSTIISDLPGLVPFCPVGWCSASPEHFQEHTTPGTTDMTAGIQAAIDYCGGSAFGTGTFGQGAVVGMLARDYLVADDDADDICLIISQSVSIKGQGKNSTRILQGNVAASATDVTVYVGKGDTAILADTAGTATVTGVLIQDIQFFNQYSSAPTAGSHIRVDRSVVQINCCNLINHYRGVEFLGVPESCKLTDSQITQGSNTGVTAQAFSAGVAILRRQMKTPTLDYVSETAPFTVGATLTGASSGATAIIRGVSDAGTTGTLTLSDLSATAFTDGEVITDNNGAPGSATSDGVVSKAAGTTYQDVSNNLYYLESNSVYITNNNVRMGATTAQNGGDYAILLGAIDGLYATNNHFAWGTTACVGLVPDQANISFTNVNITGGLIDPLPGKSQYGLQVNDRRAVSTSLIGSILLNGVQIAGCDLDGINLAMQCRRFQMNGGEIKNCGRYGLSITSLLVTDTLLSGVHIYDTDDDGTGTDAAVYLQNGQRTTISDCNINNTGRGVYVGADALRTSITGNTFEAISSGNSIYLQNNGVDKADLAACANNDIEESATVASADRIRIPVGADHIYITGTTDIWEIREDSPSSTYSNRVVNLTFASALDLKDDGGGSPPGDSSPNLRIGADFTAAAGTHATLKWQADLDKWILTATRGNG